MSKEYYDGDVCRHVIKYVTSGLDGEQAFAIGNLIKYIYRLGRKGDEEDILQDMAKAKDYVWLALKGDFYE